MHGSEGGESGSTGLPYPYLLRQRLVSRDAVAADAPDQTAHFQDADGGEDSVDRNAAD